MIQEIKKYFNPKNLTTRFAFFLFFFTLASLVDLLVYETTPGMRLNYILSALAVFVVAEAFWIWNFYSKKFPNLNFLHLDITAAIIFLLIHPTAPWWMYALALSLAIFFKSVFRYKGQPVFNPAALGVFMAYLISIPLANNDILPYPAFESWWGADLQFTFAQRFPVLAIIPGFLLGGYLYFANRFRRLHHAVAYYSTFVLSAFIYFFLFKNEPLDIWQFATGMLTGSYMFLAFIMATEPKTSPLVVSHQIGLGIFGGFLLFFLSIVVADIFPGIGIITLGTFALLILNIATLLVKKHASSGGVTPVPAKAAPVQPAQYVGVVTVDGTTNAEAPKVT